MPSFFLFLFSFLANQFEENVDFRDELRVGLRKELGRAERRAASPTQPVAPPDEIQSMGGSGHVCSG